MLTGARAIARSIGLLALLGLLSACGGSSYEVAIHGLPLYNGAERISLTKTGEGAEGLTYRLSYQAAADQATIDAFYRSFFRTRGWAEQSDGTLRYAERAAPGCPASYAAVAIDDQTPASRVTIEFREVARCP